MTPAQIAALREVSERCRAAGSRVWIEPAAVDALLDSIAQPLETMEDALNALLAVRDAVEELSDFTNLVGVSLDVRVDDAIKALECSMKGTP